MQRERKFRQRVLQGSVPLVLALILGGAWYIDAVMSPAEAPAAARAPLPQTAALAQAANQAPAAHDHAAGTDPALDADPIAADPIAAYNELNAAAGAAPVDQVKLAATADPQSLPNGWVDTPYGPIGPADRDLLVRVRQAGLWEMPSGQMAQTKAGSAKVKQVGATLMSDHQTLDVQVRALATTLGVTLPDQPNSDQQSWLAEERAANGDAFDRVFADRLRAAHGKVFAVIAAVRAGTRNDAIRSFATTANTIVMKHMTLLESTGFVNYNALPTAAGPTPTGAAGGSAGLPQAVYGQTSSKPAMVLGVVMVAILAATVLGLVKWAGLTGTHSHGR
jgi:predicted outer membrane protein